MKLSAENIYNACTPQSKAEELQKEYQLNSNNINHFLRKNEFTYSYKQIREMEEYKILNKKFEESLQKVREQK